MFKPEVSENFSVHVCTLSDLGLTSLIYNVTEDLVFVLLFKSDM